MATGGGMGAQPDIADALQEAGLVVYLEASEETLWDRVSKDETGAPRPLAMARDAFIERLEARAPRYEELADIILPTDGASIGELVDFLVDNIQRSN